MPLMPHARQVGLIVRELEDETLIFDIDANKAHCLNQTAAMVWKHCDGVSPVSQVCESLSREFKTRIEEKVVWYALQQLHKGNLLEQKIEMPAPFMIAGMSRRQMVRTLGLAAIVAVPLVTSIVAPTPAQAATCKASGASCGTSAQCCSGLCSAGTCA
jgi:hypothetical protein